MHHQHHDHYHCTRTSHTLARPRAHCTFANCLPITRDVTGLPVIVDFYSDGCGPCRMIAPVYKALSKEFKGRAIFTKVDTNRNMETGLCC